MLGKTVAWANGDEHKRHRQFVAPIFTHPRIRITEETVHTYVDRWLKVLHSRVQAASGKDGETQVEMARWLSTVALDIIGMITFSFDFGCGESEESQVILDTMEKPAQAGMVVTGWATLLLLRAFPLLAAFQNRMGLTAKQAAVRSIIREKISKALVKGRVKAVEVGDEFDRNTDFLQSLMRTTNMSDPEAVEMLTDNVSVSFHT